MLGDERSRTNAKQYPPVEVRFARSGITATWTGGSLLSLAREVGIEAPYGCRSGGCGECETRIAAGEVVHALPGVAPSRADHALICVARPGPHDGTTLVLDL